MPNNNEEEGFRVFTQEETEWYRLWFEFLKLSDRNKWSEEVEQRFGDVYSCNFEEWWPDHRYLFNKTDIFTIDVIPSEDFLHGYYGHDGKLGENPDVVGLVVHMAAKKHDLIAAFEKILSKYHLGRLTFEDFDAMGDVCDLHQKPDTDMLKKILAVYKVYAADQKEQKQNRLTLWQIEEIVSYETIQLIDKKKATLWRLKETDPSIEESRRRSQLTTVKKYLNYADEILANVVVGKFPVYTAGKASD
jgi:acyl-CoA-binding protein